MITKTLSWLRQERTTTNGLILALFLIYAARSFENVRPLFWLFTAALFLVLLVPLYDLIGHVNRRPHPRWFWPGFVGAFVIGAGAAAVVTW